MSKKSNAEKLKRRMKPKRRRAHRRNRHPNAAYKSPFVPSAFSPFTLGLVKVLEGLLYMGIIPSKPSKPSKPKDLENFETPDTVQ